MISFRNSCSNSKNNIKLIFQAKSALKLGVVVGTIPAACIALGYRMRAVQASGNNNQEGPRIIRACDVRIVT